MRRLLLCLVLFLSLSIRPSTADMDFDGVDDSLRSVHVLGDYVSPSTFTVLAWTEFLTSSWTGGTCARGSVLVMDDDAYFEMGRFDDATVCVGVWNVAEQRAQGPSGTGWQAVAARLGAGPWISLSGACSCRASPVWRTLRT